MDVVDFKKLHPEVYRAGKKIKEVEIPRGVYLCVPGKGAPGEDAYIEAIQVLYSLAYTLKFTRKFSGEQEFVVAPLETIWDVEDPDRTPRSEWEWRVVSRIPEEITAREIKQAQKTVLARKEFDASAGKRVVLRATRCLQVMHLGPYEKLGATYQTMQDFADDGGYAFNGPCVEIYLSDPRRVKPEKLKTVVRAPIKRSKRAGVKKVAAPASTKAKPKASEGTGVRKSVTKAKAKAAKKKTGGTRTGTKTAGRTRAGKKSAAGARARKKSTAGTRAAANKSPRKR